MPTGPLFHLIAGALDPVAPFSHAIEQDGWSGLARGALIEIDLVARRVAAAAPGLPSDPARALAQASPSSPP